MIQFLLDYGLLLIPFLLGVIVMIVIIVLRKRLFPQWYSEEEQPPESNSSTPPEIQNPPPSEGSKSSTSVETKNTIGIKPLEPVEYQRRKAKINQEIKAIREVELPVWQGASESLVTGLASLAWETVSTPTAEDDTKREEVGQRRAADRARQRDSFKEFFDNNLWRIKQDRVEEERRKREKEAARKLRAVYENTLKKAVSCQAKGQLEQAIDWLVQAQEVLPDEPYPQEEIKSIKKRLEEERNLLAKAALAELEGDLDAALRIYKRLLELIPNRKAATEKIVVIQQKIKDRQRREEERKRKEKEKQEAEEQWKKRIQQLQSQASLAFREKRFQQALDLYNKLAEVAPELDLEQQVDRCLEGIKRQKEEQQIVDQALIKADRLYHQGAIEEAMNDLRAVLQKIPNAKLRDTIAIYQKELSKRKEKTRLEELATRKKANSWAIQNYLAEKGVRCFYHFTDRSNLASIKAAEGLYSWTYCEHNGIAVEVFGGDGTSRSLDRHYGLEDYVRVSFVSDHPMKYVAERDGRIPNPVVLRISVDVAYLEPTLFADRNATKTGHQRGPKLENLKKVRLDVLRSRYFDLSEDSKQFYQAEVLIKTWIPLKYITFP